MAYGLGESLYHPQLSALLDIIHVHGRSVHLNVDGHALGDHSGDIQAVTRGIDRLVVCYKRGLGLLPTTVLKQIDAPATSHMFILDELTEPLLETMDGYIGTVLSNTVGEQAFRMTALWGEKFASGIPQSERGIINRTAFPLEFRAETEKWRHQPPRLYLTWDGRVKRCLFSTEEYSATEQALAVTCEGCGIIAPIYIIDVRSDPCATSSHSGTQTKAKPATGTATSITPGGDHPALEGITVEGEGQ